MPQREKILATVAKLHLRGCSQWDIVGELNKEGIKLSQPMVCNYLQDVKAAYLEEAIDSRRVMVHRQTKQYEEVMFEAWQAFNESKADREKVVKASGSNDKGSWDKEQEEREGRLPGAEYLNVINNCLASIAKLWGLNEPDVLQVRDDQYLPWEQVMDMFRRPPETITMPAIEEGK